MEEIGNTSARQREMKVKKGTPHPLGPMKGASSVNFALYSKSASSVSLVLFEKGANTPFEEISLEHKSGDIWHVEIEGLPLEFDYGYRVDGPENAFRPDLLLLDPYAKATNRSTTWGEEEKTPLLSRYIPIPPFDWQGVPRPKIPFEELLIYEMHVRGFTQDPSSKVESKGTFLGVIEKIPYLQSLGINAVELLPVFEFNEMEYEKRDPLTDERLYNFWGYSTRSFFVPMERFATRPDKGAIEEFQIMVRELHRAGIEVILDVVYNHTNEGNELGPTESFKGIDNDSYYLMGPAGEYRNFSGCGNTVAANFTPVAELIIDSLRFWTIEMGVDGFRFDLASILTRDPNGVPLASPPVIKAISEQPLFADIKLIAEAWDAGGLYQVGSFPSWGRWAEWNGKYRDRVRSFLKGTDGKAGDFARSVSGSEDLYGHDRKPFHSINFITAHDGFTIHDLVSYERKHNLRNGEENRDGENNNESWNCGAEGESSDLSVNHLRNRQMRNFLTALFLSIGTPQLLMGDEYGHTRRGNNNPWCQDNSLNWFQWDTLEKNKELFLFTQKLIALRKKHKILQRATFLQNDDVQWHGHMPMRANWAEENRLIAYTLLDHETLSHLYIAFNAQHNLAHLHLPSPPEGKNRRRVIDTSRPSPDDLIDPNEEPLLCRRVYNLPPHSALLLKAL